MIDASRAEVQFDIRDSRGTTRTRVAGGRQVARTIDCVLKRALDVLVAGSLLLVLSPLVLVVALAICIESRGPSFYRCRRVGRHGREFGMLKFRKMHRDAAGLSLTAPDDERFTRLGRLLAHTKLDELPQLFNVVCGQMSLVGPRPESPEFVQLQEEAYAEILKLRPGITGLAQLAFARESEILSDNDRLGDYVSRLLPAKALVDQLYAARRNVWLDLKVLMWTAVAVILRRDVAVNRGTAGLSLREARTQPAAASEPVAS